MEFEYLNLFDSYIKNKDKDIENNSTKPMPFKLKEKIKFDIFKENVNFKTNFLKLDYNNSTININNYKNDSGNNNTFEENDKRKLLSYLTHTTHDEEIQEYELNTDTDTNNINSNINNEFENIIHLESNEIKDSFSFDNIEIEDPIFKEEFDRLYNKIKSYTPLINQKKTLNNLLEDRIKETDNFLSSINQNNVYRQNEIFNFISFKKFKKITKIKDFKKFPLYTKLKIMKEFEKIEKKAKRTGAYFSLLFTPVTSAYITYYMYKNFSKEIRHKKKFFNNYLIKLPIVILLSSYIIMKNISLMFYSRKPMIDTNEIYGETEVTARNKESKERFKIIRLRLGEYKNVVKNKEEYENFIKCLYGEDSKGLGDRKMFKLNFYFLSYKYLRYHLYYSKKQFYKIKKYFSTIDVIDNKFKIYYVQNILLFNIYGKRINMIVQNEYFNKDLNNISKINLAQKMNNFKLKITGDKIIKNKLKSFLRDLRIEVLSKCKQDDRNNYFLQIFYFDILKSLQIKDLNKNIINYYEVQFYLKYLKHLKISNNMINYDKFAIIIRKEEEIENLNTFLKSKKVNKEIKKNLKLLNEFITPEEFKSLQIKFNELSVNRFPSIMLSSIVLSLCLNSLFLNYKT